MYSKCLGFFSFFFFSPFYFLSGIVFSVLEVPRSGTIYMAEPFSQVLPWLMLAVNHSFSGEPPAQAVWVHVCEPPCQADGPELQN